MRGILGGKCVHTLVTPFQADGSIDYDVYEKLIEFHLGHGAGAICAPMHEGENTSLTEDELREVVRFGAQAVKGRVPFVAHISRPGTLLAVGAAKHAADVGADAVIMTTPYYWTPPEVNVEQHLEIVAKSVPLPFYLYNAPTDMNGVRISVGSILKLIAASDNVVGLVDQSFAWDYLLHALTVTKTARPGFEVISGGEHMVSTQAMGGVGAFSMLSLLAPKLVARTFANVLREDYSAAREDQYKLSELRVRMKPVFPSALKAISELMGRPLGSPRRPLQPLSKEQTASLWAELEKSNLLEGEPRGWG